MVVDLGAPPARARVSHGPEVLRRSQLGDSRLGHELPPDGVRLVVAGDAVLAPEHGHVEPLGRQPPGLGQQLPGEGDGVGLEVVAEREVAEHLEERVVAERGAHVLEVVVLAADPHALLRGGRPPVVAALRAQKDVLELVHAGVGEQQRRIAGGHERRARHDAVALRAEVVEKALADLGGRHRVNSVTRRRQSPSSGVADARARARSAATAMWLSNPCRSRYRYSRRNSAWSWTGPLRRLPSARSSTVRVSASA